MMHCLTFRSAADLQVELDAARQAISDERAAHERAVMVTVSKWRGEVADVEKYAKHLQGAAAYAVLIFGKVLNGGSYQRSDIVEAQNKLADAVRADGSFLCDAFKAQKADDAPTMKTGEHQ